MWKLLRKYFEYHNRNVGGTFSIFLMLYYTLTFQTNARKLARVDIQFYTNRILAGFQGDKLDFLMTKRNVEEDMGTAMKCHYYKIFTEVLNQLNMKKIRDIPLEPR